MEGDDARAQHDCFIECGLETVEHRYRYARSWAGSGEYCAAGDQTQLARLLRWVGHQRGTWNGIRLAVESRDPDQARAQLWRAEFARCSPRRGAVHRHGPDKES